MSVLRHLILRLCLNGIHDDGVNYDGGDYHDIFPDGHILSTSELLYLLLTRNRSGSV
jgi:hypothetical protein